MMAIKGRILTRFPARIVGAPGTDLSYSGGVLTIDAPPGANGANGTNSAADCTGTRLSLTTGVAITTSDVAGATAVYGIAVGKLVTLIYDGVSDVSHVLPTQTTLTLTSGAHILNTGYDVFEAWVSGSYFLGTGPAWSNSGGGTSSRGTGAGTTEVHSFNGRRTNSNSITLTNGATTHTIAADQANLLGGFRTTIAGATEDSVSKRFVWNEYNALDRGMILSAAASTWNFATTTPAVYRQANASSANQLAMFSGASGRVVTAEIYGLAIAVTPSGARVCSVGFGINSTSVNSADFVVPATPTSATNLPSIAAFTGYLPLGYNVVVWLESNDVTLTDTITWIGSVSAFAKTGMQCRVIQ